MRALLVLLLCVASLGAQDPCLTGAGPLCPCGPKSPLPGLALIGKKYVGTTQWLQATALDSARMPTAFLAIGTPALAPVRVAPGVLVCADGTEIPTLHIDPLGFVPVAFAASPHVQGHVVAKPCYLALPNTAALIGRVVYAQYFESRAGPGGLRLVPSPIVAFRAVHKCCG